MFRQRKLCDPFRMVTLGDNDHPGWVDAEAAWLHVLPLFVTSEMETRWLDTSRLLCTALGAFCLTSMLQILFNFTSVFPSNHLSSPFSKLWALPCFFRGLVMLFRVPFPSLFLGLLLSPLWWFTSLRWDVSTWLLVLRKWLSKQWGRFVRCLENCDINILPEALSPTRWSGLLGKELKSGLWLGAVPCWEPHVAGGLF